MTHIYTFEEVDGSRLVATANRDGANLLGGSKLWKRLAKFAVDEMDDLSGIAAMGNIERSCATCRATAYISPQAGRPDWLAGQGYARHREDPEEAN